MTFHTKGDDRNWTLKSISWVGREWLGTLKGVQSDITRTLSGDSKQLHIYLIVFSGAKQRRLVHRNVPKELSAAIFKLKQSEQRVVTTARRNISSNMKYHQYHIKNFVF